MDFLTIRIMIIFRKYLLPFLFCVIVTGCYSDFEPDIKSTPVVCMNTLITEGEKIIVSVTRTWRWSEGDVNNFYEEDGIDLGIYNAEVKLFVNGEYKETLKLKTYEHINPYYTTYPWVSSGNGGNYKAYEADYIPVAGDLIRLEAKSEQYGEAFGEVVIPQSVEIKNVNYEVNQFQLSEYEETSIYHFNLNATVRFTDPDSTVDYYMFKTSSSGYNFQHNDEEGLRWGNYVMFYDRSDEPLFTEHVSALDHIFSDTFGYSFFTDRQISGKTYPLHVYLENVTYTISDPFNDPSVRDGYLKFVLYSISKSYYDHVISVWVENDAIIGSLGSIGLGEPVFSSSNVSTGAGVIAAASKYEYILPLNPIIDYFSNSNKKDN